MPQNTHRSMILNQTILDHYHNELLEGGPWTTKTKKKMTKKYFIYREQHIKMEPPTKREHREGPGHRDSPLQEGHEEPLRPAG